MCPFNGSMIRRPASLHRVRRGPFPGFCSTIRTLRLPADHPAALRRLRLAVPPSHPVVRSDRPEMGQPIGQECFGCGHPPDRALSVESTGSPKFLGSPHGSFAVLSDPGRPASPRPLRDGCAALASDTTKAPALCVSRLYHTASELAVYASPDGSLHHSATRASGRWSSFPGQALLPAGLR